MPLPPPGPVAARCLALAKRCAEKAVANEAETSYEHRGRGGLPKAELWLLLLHEPLRAAAANATPLHATCRVPRVAGRAPPPVRAAGRRA